jgi:hypothetical protein
MVAVPVLLLFFAFGFVIVFRPDLYDQRILPRLTATLGKLYSAREMRIQGYALMVFALCAIPVYMVIHPKPLKGNSEDCGSYEDQGRLAAKSAVATEIVREGLRFQTAANPGLRLRLRPGLSSHALRAINLAKGRHNRRATKSRSLASLVMTNQTKPPAPESEREAEEPGFF